MHDFDLLEIFTGVRPCAVCRQAALAVFLVVIAFTVVGFSRSNCTLVDVDLAYVGIGLW